jgi:hypothetical protein
VRRGRDDLLGFANTSALQNEGGPMDLEKRFIAVESTKLRLKGFLTGNSFIFI